MTYTGSWRDGLKDGSGVLHFPNGDTLTGRWKEGIIDGPVDFKFHEGSPWLDPEY